MHHVSDGRAFLEYAGRDIVTALRRAAVGLLICVATAALAACATPGQTNLTLATTTSVAHSGLLDDLSPAFTDESGIVIRAHLVGSGRALRMLETANAEAVITHAPATEAEYLAKHPDWRYRKIMFNRFLIVGPRGDPANVRAAEDAADAMRRIARTAVKFVSRGDSSGTHERELDLWRHATVRPDGDRYVIAGQGMSGALRIASEIGAYTLTDNATYAQLETVLPNLEVLHDGDVRLLNTYAVVIPGNPSAAARRLTEWLARGNGRSRIHRYRVRGTPVFEVWPHGAPGARPDDVPR